MEQLIKELFNEESSSKLKSVEKILTKKELEILKYRHNDLLTFEEIGKFYGDTKQHVSQSYKRCLKKLNRLKHVVISEDENNDIEKLPLSNRAYNALKVANVNKIDSLLKLSDEQLLKFKGLGKIVLEEIKNCLAECGYERLKPTLIDDVDVVLKKYNLTINELIEELRNV